MKKINNLYLYINDERNSIQSNNITSFKQFELLTPTCIVRNSQKLHQKVTSSFQAALTPQTVCWNKCMISKA